MAETKVQPSTTETQKPHTCDNKALTKIIHKELDRGVNLEALYNRKVDPITFKPSNNPKAKTIRQIINDVYCPSGDLSKASSLFKIKEKLKVKGLLDPKKTEANKPKVEKPLTHEQFSQEWEKTQGPKPFDAKKNPVGEIYVPPKLKAQVQAEVLASVETQPDREEDLKDPQLKKQHEERVISDTQKRIAESVILQKKSFMKKRSAKTGELIKPNAQDKDGKKIKTISDRINEIAKKSNINPQLLQNLIASNFKGFNLDKKGNPIFDITKKDTPNKEALDKYFKSIKKLAELPSLNKKNKSKIDPQSIKRNSDGSADLSDPATARAAAQAAGLSPNQTNDLLKGKLTAFAILAKILLWFLTGAPPKFNDKGQPIDPKTNKPMINPDTKKPYTRAEYDKKFKKSDGSYNSPAPNYKRTFESYEPSDGELNRENPGSLVGLNDPLWAKLDNSLSDPKVRRRILGLRNDGHASKSHLIRKGTLVAVNAAALKAKELGYKIRVTSGNRHGVSKSHRHAQRGTHGGDIDFVIVDSKGRRAPLDIQSKVMIASRAGGATSIGFGTHNGAGMHVSWYSKEEAKGSRLSWTYDAGGRRIQHQVMNAKIEKTKKA